MRKIFTLLFFFGTFFVCIGQYTLPRLPFKYSALEPYMDSTTMNIHLNQHHASYMNNLNKLMEKHPYLKKSSLIELLSRMNKLPADIQTSIRNNGGGYFNHCLFWNLLARPGTAPMSHDLQKKLEDNFGTVEAFQNEFEKAALNQIGSGWVWLIPESSGKLRIVATANQDNTLMSVAPVKGTPVLALDIWEHAYYLKYQSRRADYVKAFWNVVNWTEVERLIKVSEKINE